MATHKRLESESKTTEEVWRSSSSNPLGGSRKAAGGEWGHRKKTAEKLSFFWWPLGDLNPRPTDYESAALTN